MKVMTVRFGELDVPEDQLILFPGGILGFPGLTRYVLIDVGEDCPFKWLQCVEEPGLAFVVMDPRLFKPDYVVRASALELADIGLSDPTGAVVYVILSQPGPEDDLTGNLKGPLVANPQLRLAKQLVLQDPEYSTRHTIVPGGQSPSATEVD